MMPSISDAAETSAPVVTTAEQPEEHHRHPPLGIMTAVGALGVVFGDIGTSPLYALQAALSATGHEPPTALDVRGIVSLIFWALTIVVSLKYVAIVLRADNEGEGGILALVALVSGVKGAKRRLSWVVLLGIVGAAMLYGDGAITPAISVLSAIEGLKVQAPGLASYVIPITVVILIGLFSVQSRGTGALGVAFGPIMLAWFAVIGGLGVYGISQAPEILTALNPREAFVLMTSEPAIAFAIFGAVFLALTGAEALYADVGHFGAGPVRLAWFAVAYPALVLNYLGQGGLLLTHPDAYDNPFYKLTPSFLLLPMVLLAAVATVIASQALISGVFSLTRQAIALHLMPRMTIHSTSGSAYGQIYVPLFNWLLMAATVLIVIGFKSSDALASAYGIAVSATMLITTLLLYRVMLERWNWQPLVATLVTLLFAVVDFGFLSANAMKIVDGGWLPLAIALLVGYFVISWRLGITAIENRLEEGSISRDAFLAHLNEGLIGRIPGCGVFVTRLSKRASPMLQHQVRTNKVLHEHVVLLTIEPTRRPRVRAAERLTVTELGNGIHGVVVKIGFMQRAEIPVVMRGLAKLGLEFCRSEVSYYIAHETLVRRTTGQRLPGIVWFAFNLMHRLSLRAADYFHLPPKRVMEVGFRLDI